MAFYVLHNVLFPVTKLANQHLLLDEFYRIEWKQINRRHERNSSSSSLLLTEGAINNQGEQNRFAEAEQAEFISTHTILFGMSLINFGLSQRCLNKIHEKRDHKQYLFKLLLTLLLSQFGYLYTINTIGSLSELFTFTRIHDSLHCIHGLILLVFSTILQWSQFVVGSICETLSVRNSANSSSGVGNLVRNEKDPPTRSSLSSLNKSFIGQLMIGAFCSAFMSLSLSELFINNQSYERVFVGDNQIGYTNTVLIMAILSTLFELVSLELLTNNYLQQPMNMADGKRRTMITSTTVDLNCDIDLSDSFRNLRVMAHEAKGDKKSLSPIIWSISAKNIRKDSETTHSIDDDEFDNSTLSYNNNKNTNNLNFQPFNCAQLRETTKRLQQVISLDLGGSGDIELFDRTKYSLYEEEEEDDDNDEYNQSTIEGKQETSRKNSKQIPTEEFVVSQQQQQQLNQQQEQNSTNNQPQHFSSVFEVLLIGDRPFVWQSLALILIGTVYQSNQLCFFSEYISYLLYKSPWKFRLTILSGWFGRADANHLAFMIDSAQVIFATVWICLICMSLILQNIARILALQYANYIHTKIGGTDKLLKWLIIIAAIIPFQFICNYHLIEISSYDLIPMKTRTIIILSHILSIQFIVGLLGALVDFIINILALQYSHQLAAYSDVAAHRSSKILSPKRSVGSIHCTIHGLLNGSFLFIGTATMSAIRILVDNAGLISLPRGENGEDDAAMLMTMLFAFAPAMVMLVLTILLGFHKWTFGRILNGNQ